MASPEAPMYAWPPVSFARMKAGLRSALKTECSGFKFQNGGRSVRWFREHPVRHHHRVTAVSVSAQAQREGLFWQGYDSLFELCWDDTGVRDTDPAFWRAFIELDWAYRERYPKRDGYSHMQAMLAAGNFERALRWAIDRRSGLKRTLCSSRLMPGESGAFDLALVGGWVWILQDWKGAVAASATNLGDPAWRRALVQGAVAACSLDAVQRYWSSSVFDSYVQAHYLAGAIGNSGSVEVYDWIYEQLPRLAILTKEVMYEACRHGNLELMEHVYHEDMTTKHMNEWAFSAAGHGHLQAVEWLLSKGATPDVDLIRAASNHGNLDLVQYLHRAVGADCEYRLYNFSCPLQASRPDCLALLEYVTQHFRYETTSSDLAIAATVANVRTDVLRFLVKHVSQEEWDEAWCFDIVKDDLDVQDLLLTAAREAGRM